jgi:DNA-binding transcriptional regulator YhcF (GntR family)
MLALTIDRSLEDPVYEQIANQVRRLVASGALSPGTPLPSVRQLAGDLGVNLNTIARAYRLLDSEGFLVIRDRAGVAVATPAEEIELSARAALLDQMRTTLARLRQAGMATDELLAIIHLELEGRGLPARAWCSVRM